MAQIVMIDTGTVRPDKAFVGDIVSIHEDNVELSGPGYASFKVLKIPKLSAEEVKIAISKCLPEIKVLYKSVVNAGDWTDVKPERAYAWSDGVTTKQIENMPKYAVTLKDLGISQISDLASHEVAKADKTITLESMAAASLKVRTDINQKEIVITKPVLTPPEDIKGEPSSEAYDPKQDPAGEG